MMGEPDIELAVMNCSQLVTLAGPSRPRSARNEGPISYL